MKTPPLWKIKRELLRLAKQFIELPRKLIWYFFATPFYDIYLSKKRQVFQGTLPPRNKIAIVLIFPQYGLKPSHLRMLEYFADKKYATLVVSNIRVSDEDRAHILKSCWTYIERPNFGYDFGGYRDGVLHISEYLNNLERLVLINDSCWFPLPEKRDWVDDVDALNVEFGAAASNYGIARPEISDYQSIRWLYSSKHPSFHYCSFALSIDKKVLKNSKFLTYWHNFHLENDKKRIVRRGEIGLTQWILENGYSHGSTCDIQHLNKDLDAVTINKTASLLAHLIIPADPRLAQLKHEILARRDSSDNWRSEAIAFILTAVARQGISYALPDFTTQEYGFPFLKKSPMWLDEDSSDITLKLILEYGDQSGKDILSEALELRRNRAAKFSTAEIQS